LCRRKYHAHPFNEYLEENMPSFTIDLAIFLPSARAGGAEKAMIALAGGLARRGLHVELIFAQAEGPFLADIDSRVHVHNLNAGRVRRAIPRLALCLRRRPPRWLIGVMAHAGAAALLARMLARAPTQVVVSLQNLPEYILLRSGKPIDRLISLLCVRLFPRAERVVTIACAVADDVARVFGLPRDEIEVIPNPLHLEEIDHSTQGPLDHPWFEPGEPPVLLNVGRLTPQKDHATLLRAFRRLLDERPARLLILGEGEERPALERLARELSLTDSVSLPGFAANPYAYMKRARLYVSSSAWEGLPVVLLEALACGMPIVSTDCPGGPTEVLAKGEYGELVPVGDDARMTAAILRALETPPKPGKQRARALDFKLESVVQAWLELLDLHT
jgi:glycosyltransferase involved in cell wall biosynthesis